jgi:hypothetical protein
MDAIGWFIVTSHNLLGHDKTAMLIGVPPGRKADCVICQYEARPDEIRRQRVLEALAP